MLLANGTIGMIVIDKDESIGHITGLTTNSTDEVIFEICWANGMYKDNTTARHPSNVRPID